MEQAYLPVMLEARESLPALEQVIVVDGDAPEGTIALADLEGSNPDFDATAAASEVTGDDIATLIYTSGTTGPPKGVEIPHRALMCTERSYQEVLALQPRIALHLLAAGGPHRRAQLRPLHPGRLRGHDHLRAEPARDHRLPATGAARLVLRGASDLGEDEGRRRGEARAPAR